MNLYTSPADLKEFFELFREPDWLPRYNLGPMQSILVIRREPNGVRQAELMQWGIVPGWAKDSSLAANMINARSDTVTTKPAFQNAIRQRRCLIPVTGYYEWQHVSRTLKQAWHVCRTDGHPLVLAGIWEHWRHSNGHELRSCAIITTNANEQLSEIHTRMPVFLPRESWDVWLQEHEIGLTELTQLFAPNSCVEVERTPVSSFVNNVRNDSPECIRPVKPPRTLF